MLPPVYGEPADPLSLYTSAQPSSAENPDETNNSGETETITLAVPERLSDIKTVEESEKNPERETQPESLFETSATPDTVIDTEPVIKSETVTATAPPSDIEIGTQEDIVTICQRIGKKLGSVSTDDCLAVGFSTPRFYSNHHQPLLEKHFYASSEQHNAPRILFLGGIHGDEYSSVSISFKWLKILQENHSGIYDWHFMPLTNPDGLL